MGVYSKRFLEESIKKKRIVDESMLEDIDINVEKVLSNLRREYPGNTQVIVDASKLILHKISENYDDFVNDRGTINVDNFSKFVTNVVKTQTEKSQESNQETLNRKPKNIENINNAYNKGNEGVEKTLGEQERERSINNARKVWAGMSEEEKRDFVAESKGKLGEDSKDRIIFNDDKDELVDNVSQKKAGTKFINFSKLKAKFFDGTISEEDYQVLKNELQRRYKEGKIKEDYSNSSYAMLKAIEDKDTLDDARLEFFGKMPAAFETFIKEMARGSKDAKEFFEKFRGTALEKPIERYFHEFNEIANESEEVKFQKIQSLIRIDSIETIRKAYPKLRDNGYDLNKVLQRLGLEEASDMDLTALSNLGSDEERDNFFNFWVKSVNKKFETFRKANNKFEPTVDKQTQYSFWTDFESALNNYRQLAKVNYDKYGFIDWGEKNLDELPIYMNFNGKDEYVNDIKQFSLVDCIENNEMLFCNQFEEELEMQTNQYLEKYKKSDLVAKVTKSITGVTTKENIRAKPKEMVLDYLEMDINSGADPKNATLVMADMLRDKKLLTKFKGASETGLSLEEYAEIMSGVVMETEQLIEEGKLPETITENGVDRQTSIDDFINMTFDDTEILLSNLPERISGLSREEIAQLIADKVKESTREQEAEIAENATIIEEQENSSQETINQDEQDKLAVRLQQEQAAQETRAQEEAVQETVVQEEVQPQEKALVADKDRTLMQRASAGFRQFFKEAKEKVGNFFESLKERFGGKSDDKFGSEVYAIDATKKENEQKKKEEDQWQTIDGKENLRAAQEEAKRKTEKEPVSVGERDE